MRYKAVVFDLDGTLLNTLEDLTDSTNYALAACGYPQRDITEIRYFVGNGIHKLIERAVPDGISSDELEKCFKIFCEHYKGNMENKTAPYDGINDMLKSLYENGVKLAVVTNKAEFAAKELVKRLFGEFVSVVIGGNDKRPLKPAPDGVLDALKLLGAEKHEAVFVGDSEVDIQTAKNAELECIGVLWGFRKKEEIEKLGVKATAETAQELEKILLS